MEAENHEYRTVQLASRLWRSIGVDSRSEGMKGAIRRAEQLQVENPDYFMLQQFKNQSNGHDGKLDSFISGSFRWETSKSEDTYIKNIVN